MKTKEKIIKDKKRGGGNSFQAIHLLHFKIGITRFHATEKSIYVLLISNSN